MENIDKQIGVDSNLEAKEIARRKKLFTDYMHSTEYQEYLLQRMQVNDACSRKPEARGITWNLCARPDNMAEGCIFFIENFGWTFDPRPQGAPHHLPFKLFEYQKDTIRWLIDHIENGKDGLLEKSRDMGMSWIIFVYVPLWYWLFKDGTNLLLGSYKQDLVDNRCYSDDTEVLTKDGWKFFRDVDINKDVFATRSKNKEFEWQKAYDKVRYDYEGDFYNLKSRSMDLMVSPNHRILYTKYWGKQEHIDKAENLYNYSGVSIPATSNWTGKEITKFTLESDKSILKDYGRGRKYQTKPTGGIEMDGDDYCAFMGMYIAEGSAIGRKNKYNASKTRISISQQEKSKGYIPYKELLIKIFGKEPTINKLDEKINGWAIRNKKLYEYLKQFGYSYEKFIPELIKDATPKQLEIFLYYYMLGDGCWATAMPTMTTVSKKLADDLQEIIQKIGNSSSISVEKPRDGWIKDRKILKENCKDSYTLRIRNTTQQNVIIEKTYYKGDIWCVTVPNEILYVRRNGKPAWCGNTKDSLFGMLDYAMDNLPKWLLPKGYNKDKHRNQMKLSNPVNYNLIAGDTMNPDFGRGTRKTAVLFDELGTWDYSKDAWESCGDVTACRIANSTPKGYNYYAQLRNSGMDVFTAHWRQHPLKDDKWYEFECSRRTEEEVAQELDISYNKSQEGRVYAEWNESNVEQGLFEYDHNLPLYVGWDFGRDDDTAIIWCQPYQGGYKVVDSFSKTGKLIDYFIPFITGILPSDHHTYTPKELEMIDRHKYWNKGTHFGDPAGRFHNQVSNETVISTLKQFGIVINFQDRWKEFSKRKTAAKLMIRDHLYINKNAYTDYFVMCLSQASYPKVRSAGLEEIRSEKPLHNWTAHYRSAFEYLALGLREYTPVKRIPYDKFSVKKLQGRTKSLSY